MTYEEAFAKLTRMALPGRLPTGKEFAELLELDADAELSDADTEPCASPAPLPEPPPTEPAPAAVPGTSSWRLPSGKRCYYCYKDSGLCLDHAVRR